MNHDLLMTHLGKKIRDKSLLKLIYKYLRTGIVEDGVLQDCREGVPQGGPLSPLLSNIMLDPLDKELEKRGHTFARWADDFIIVVVNSKRAGDRVLKSITRFIEQKLKLKVNDQKSRVVPTSKSKFLGFTFRGKSIVWHTDAERKFKQEIKNLTGRSSGKSIKKIIHELTVYMRGWINYFTYMDVGDAREQDAVASASPKGIKSVSILTHGFDDVYACVIGNNGEKFERKFATSCAEGFHWI